MNKLKEFQDKLHDESLKEIYEDLSDSFLNFLSSDVMNYCFHEIKVGTKNQQSARVLNSWINNEVIFVNEKDRGKIRRFDRLESIWLNLVIESRKFGLPLDLLKQTRNYLMSSPVRDFSLLKFAVFDSIMGKPKMIMIFEDGFANIISLDTYNKYLFKRNISFPTHLSFKLDDFVATEFPNNAFQIDFKINDADNDEEKLTLLYFLKTGDYKLIKLIMEDGDIRLIENSNMISKNENLFNVIASWSFQKIEIIVSDEVKINITP